ncbi:MAG TPA: hypothetical protein DEA08_36245 [Planctomycetes bacterium]|nr:hypothetical protein [Planctomycetota bacterium]
MELPPALPARVELTPPQVERYVGGGWLPTGDVIGLSDEGALYRWAALPDGGFDTPRPLRGGQASRRGKRREVWLVGGERGPFSGFLLELHWLDEERQVTDRRPFDVRQFAYGPSGERLALLDLNRGLLVLDRSTRATLLRLEPQELRFERVGFLARDRLWLSQGDRKDSFARGSTHGRVEVWSETAGSWQRTAAHPFHWVPTNLLALGPEAWLLANNLGQVFRCSSEGELGELLVAKEAGDAVLRRAIRGSVTQLVRVDEEHVLVASNGPCELRWFRLSDGENVKTIALRWDLTATLLSPDARRLLVSGAGGKLLVLPASPY